MNAALSANTQAILLLTAPLITGQRVDSAPNPLSLGEYKQLARFLRQQQSQPADLLGSKGDALLSEQSTLDNERLTRLLQRGFQLSQAMERWQSRAIWVLSRADRAYPRRLKERLREDSPPILYGCGDAALLETGGLAVVGSRHVDQSLIEYAEAVGQLTARAGRTVVSGGARGIDQAAMRGALEAGGRAAGILADSLERATLNRDYRARLIESQLVLVSPYDPQAGFNVGNAMQRNKLIYALADAALVVSSDYEKGGTWAGAVEQLEKFHFVPVFARVDGDATKGLRTLNQKGALRWPNPGTPAELAAALTGPTQRQPYLPPAQQLSLLVINEPAPEYQIDVREEPGNSP